MIKMKQTSPEMSQLYAVLAAAGWAPAWVRKHALPAWWCDDEASSASSAAMARGFIARHLGLDAAALGRGEAVCAEDATLRHKKNLGKNEAQMKWASCLAVRAARLSLAGAVPHLQPAKEGAAPTAKTLRRALLRANEFVSLRGVLELCWDLGIPVLPIFDFPAGTHKMDGLAVTFGGRSAIVLSKKHRYSAAMLFVLAHELGHILLGHCGDNGISMDKNFSWDADDDDAECERRADEFAVELLTGEPDTVYVSDLWLTSEQLADAARAMSLQNCVDPGVVALNYAWGKNFHQVGRGALKIIEPDADAAQTVQSVCAQRMRWENLTEESAFYLQRLLHIADESSR